MFYFVEREIENCESGEGVEALDVANEIVVEVQFCKVRAKGIWKFNLCYCVLAEAEAVEVCKAVKLERWY
jgi:hypothetical protein